MRSGRGISTSIVIQPGTHLIRTGGGGTQDLTSYLDIAGTGANGLGALQHTGDGWINVTNIKLSGNATINNVSGGVRFDGHAGGINQLNLNGKTLQVNGGAAFYLVNTTVVGGGVINVNGSGEFNFEASSILPADATLNLTNARSSSWDGAGRTMLGAVSINNSILENRQNDGGKTYAGPINITGDARFRVITENGTSNNFMVVSGQVSGSGKLIDRKSVV